MEIAHWFLHITGIDTQQSPFYDFWSGFGTQISPLVAVFIWYHHHTCHIKGCYRFAKYHVDDYMVCKKHRKQKEK